MPSMEIAPATTPEKIVFRLKHSDKAVECSAASLVLSPFSDSPNQLWSKFQGVNGQCFINRGTGAYLEVENGAVQTKIEASYEWNIQEQGGSVRLETLQKVLKATSQLSPDSDADAMFVIDYDPDPTLSVGSEDYVHSLEHTCVTNHIFNAVNAVNAIIHILEHPDKDPLSNLDVMVVRYTTEHFAQFKARGNEATQNFDFAGATVASWFSSIGAKIEAEEKNCGNLTKANELQEAKHIKADATLKQLTATHQGTLASVRTQQTKYNTANTEYNNAVTVHNDAISKEKSAKKSYDESSYAPDPSGSGGMVLSASRALSRAQNDLKIAKEKMDSKQHEQKGANDLLITLKGNSAKEETEMAKLQSEINTANLTMGNNSLKSSQLKAHQNTLINLQNSINHCRTHLANTLEYKVNKASSLTEVRRRVKGIVEVLQKDEDFKEPLKILDRAALDELVKKIPDISQHAIAEK